MCLPGLVSTCPHPYSRPLPAQTSAGDCQTLTGRSGSISCELTAPFPLGPGMHKVLFVPSKSLCFPQSFESSSKSFLGDSQSLCWILRYGNLMWCLEPSYQCRKIWYYCSPTCGLLIWWVWDLILTWLHPSYCLVVSPISLNRVSFFWWILMFYCQWLWF